MNQKWVIRIGFLIFLFAIGFLVGAGISKTIKHISNNNHVKEVIIPLAANYGKSMDSNGCSHLMKTKA